MNTKRKRNPLAVFVLLLAIACACTSEDTAFPTTPPAPNPEKFNVVVNQTRAYQSRHNTQQRRFTLHLKNGFAPQTFAAEFDELLGPNVTNIFSYNSSGVALTEQDNQSAAFVFNHPIDLAQFPLSRSKIVSINTTASSIDSINNQESLVLVHGTVRNSHIGIVHVTGHALRAMIIDVAINITNTKLTASDQTDSAPTKQQTRHQVTGELWFVPSYSLFVGGKLQDIYFGNNVSGKDNYTANINWQITNLPS